MMHKIVEMIKFPKVEVEAGGWWAIGLLLLAAVGFIVTTSVIANRLMG